MAEVSVAGRGLFALERLLYGEASGERACAVTRAVAADLARMADETQAGWTDGFAETLLTAGETGNTTFLSAREARQAVFTQLIGGFEFVADQRLGRPLGSLDRPRPERAEARLSGRTIRNISLSLDAFGTMAAELVPETPKTQAAIARAERLAAALPPDTFARLGDPQIWLKVQILQQAVHVARDAALAEIGPALDVGVGFNAADGD
jgi:predicted lipoprotein